MACKYIINGLEMTQQEYEAYLQQTLNTMRESNPELNIVNLDSTEIQDELMNAIFTKPSEFDGDVSNDTIVDDENSGFRRKKPFENYIDNLKGQVKMLEKELSTIRARKYNIKDKTSPQYEKLHKAEAQIKYRLHGNKLNKNHPGYVPGLVNTLEDFLKQVTINELSNSLQRDINRLAQLAAKESLEYEELVEASGLVEFFESFTTLPSRLTNSNHGVLSADQYYIFVNGEMTRRPNPQAESIYEYLAGISNSKEMIELRNKVQEKKRKIIDNILKENPHIQKVYTEKSLTYDQMFDISLKDITWWEKYMMDNGVTGTFAETGEAPKVMKMILEQKLNEYLSRCVKWEEKLKLMTPALTKKLADLGYGLVSKGLKFKALGVSYKLFYSKNEDGSVRSELIDRVSGKFKDADKASSTLFYNRMASASKAGPNESHAIVIAAARERRRWRKEHTIMVDPRKIPEIKAEFENDPEFAKYFVDDPAHSDELKSNIRSEAGYNEIVQQQIQKIKEYKVHRQRFINDMLADTGADSIDELSDANKLALLEMEERFNPLKLAYLYDASKMGSVGNNIVVSSMDSYNMFVPRRNKIKYNKEGKAEQTNINTGYYEADFETIEADPVLYEFYRLAKEMLETSYVLLSPDQQRKMTDNTIIGIKKNIMEVMLDPDMQFGKKIMPTMGKLFDVVANMLRSTESQDKLSSKVIVNSITRKITPDVNEAIVGINTNDVMSKFTMVKTKFVRTLPMIYGNAFRSDKNKRVGDTYNTFNSNTTMLYTQFSTKSKDMLRTMLGIPHATEKELMDALEVSAVDNTVNIGRILYNLTVSEIVGERTYDLPKILKAYSYGAAMYGARNEAKPMLQIFRDEFNKIKKFVKKDVNENEVVDSIRHEAVQSMDNFMQKQVLGHFNQSKWGKLGKVNTALKGRFLNYHMWIADISLASLKHDERTLFKAYQEMLDEEMEKPEELRDKEFIEQTKAAQNSLGQTFYMSAFFDRLLSLVRLRGLALNFPSAFNNLMYGKISNYIHAGLDWSYSNESYWRAEHLVLSSQLRTFTGGMITRPAAKKIAIMMRRFDVFQDATNEIYKALENSGYKIPTGINVYMLQRRTEYVNQSTVLVAMMLDKKIKGKDGQESSLWDALDANGNLKEGFNTEENKKDWEETYTVNGYEFKKHVENVIKNNHGDYTELGANSYSEKHWYRTLTMFLRWLPRAVHERLATEQKDFQTGKVFKGRYRSFTPISAGVLAAVAGFAAYGTPIGAGIMAGLAIATTFGAKKFSGGTSVQTEMNLVREALVRVTQLLVGTLALPVQIAASITTGVDIKKKLGLNALDKMHMKNNIDEMNMRANMKDAVLLLQVLLFKMVFLGLKRGTDDEDDERLKELNVGINSSQKLIADMTSFCDPLQAYDSYLKKPTVLSLINDIGTTLNALGHWDELSKNPMHYGETRGHVAMDKMLPSVFRDEYGIETIGQKIFDANEIDVYFKPYDKRFNEIITDERAAYRAALKAIITPDYEEQHFDEIVNDVKRKFPEISDRLAIEKAEAELDRRVKKITDKITDSEIPGPAKMRKTIKSKYGNVDDKEQYKIIRDHFKKIKRKERTENLKNIDDISDDRKLDDRFKK